MGRSQAKRRKTVEDIEDVENKEQPKPTILIIGDGVATTGFARVLHSVFQHLTDQYHIHHLAINYRGDPHGYDWKIYPAMLGGDIYGLGRLPEMMNVLKPDLVFILNDLWVHPMYLDKLQEYKDVTKVILYMPIDGGPVDPIWVKQIRGADRLIFYTRFGKGVVEDAIAKLQADEWEEITDTTATKVLRKRKVPLRFPKIHIVPHGIDTRLFHPVDKEKAKAEIYPENPDFKGDAFIVLNSNRNQPRKRIDITMKGFAQFAEDKPSNVKLYLHMGVEDMGWNVINLAKLIGIENRLVLSSTQNTIPGIPDDRLNLIYNACNVGINTSVGEGWGLCNFEHAATFAAQIVPDHSACSEVWRIDGKEMAEFLPVEYWLTNERVLTEGGIVTPQGVAEALEHLYSDREYLDEMAQRAFDLTRSPEYQWQSVAKQFNDIFMDVLAE